MIFFLGDSMKGVDLMLDLQGALFSYMKLKAPIDDFIDIEVETVEEVEKDEIASIFASKIGAPNYDVAELVLILYEPSEYEILISKGWVRISCIPELLEAVKEALKELKTVKTFSVTVKVTEEEALRYIVKMAKLIGDVKSGVSIDENTIERKTTFNIDYSNLGITITITERIYVHDKIERDYSVSVELKSKEGIDVNSALRFLNSTLGIQGMSI